MNTEMTFCVYGEQLAILSFFVEKPPVAIVVNA